ncbi:MAG: hypothetical protein ACLTBV_17660 [Enterocloster bolteae]
MDYKLHITEQAVEQLDWIISYLVSNLKNPTAARKLLSEIEIIYSYLESDPHITLNVTIRFYGQRDTTKQLSIIFNM